MLVALTPDQNARPARRFADQKTASGIFFHSRTTRARKFCRKSLDSRRVARPATTKTVSGVRYYGFRYYNPSTGRWLSRDPIQENGGLNLYSILANDTINHWDYLGLLLPVDSDFRPASAVDATWMWGHNDKWETLAWTGRPTNGENNGSDYDLSFTVEKCNCLLGKMRLWQQIYRNDWYIQNNLTKLGYTWDNIYGHEQAHITSMLAEFRRIRTLIEKEKACFASKEGVEKGSNPNCCYFFHNLLGFLALARRNSLMQRLTPLNHKH